MNRRGFLSGLIATGLATAIDPERIFILRSTDPPFREWEMYRKLLSMGVLSIAEIRDSFDLDAILVMVSVIEQPAKPARLLLNP